MDAKNSVSYSHLQLYRSLIDILSDLTDQQLAYSTPQIDTRPIRDIAIHAYRPVLAIVCVLAGEDWPARPQSPTTKAELFTLLQAMHTHIHACIICISPTQLEQGISLPWKQQQNGLEALIDSFMHGMLHIGAIQGIRACGGFPTPPEEPKPARR
jgi:hypothetical protein